MISEFIDKLKIKLNRLVNTFEIDIESHIKKYVEDNYQDFSINKNTNDDLEIIIGEYYFLIDIKYQDINKTYSFPNMISINKAKDILSNKSKNIIYIFIEYENFQGERDEKHRIDKITVQRIETLDWEYLYIQNIGKGQLQIKNISKQEFVFNNDVKREEWLKILKEKGIEYYNNLMLKVVEYKSEWESE